MQKQLLPILFLSLFSAGAFCQKTVFIDRYILPAETKPGLVIVSMPFGYSNILSVSGDTAGLRTAGDIFVDVACTDYPINASLVSLNKSRVASFLKQFSFIEESQLSQINFFQQTDGALREKALTMFHGLVVTFRPKQTLENAKKEVIKLEEIVKIAITPPTEIGIAAPQKESAPTELERLLAQRPRKFQNGKWYVQVGRAGIVSVDGDLPKKSPLDSFIVREPKDALDEELISKAEYKEFRSSTAIRIYYPHWVTEESLIPKKTVPAVTKTVITVNISKIPDTSILQILDRTKWEKATIVVDVTGSMYKYTAQVLLWVKTNPIGKTARNFVFFNDGDNKPDREKKIGNTGGIYFRNCQSYGEIEALMKSTMLKGAGGDHPENNIEALITGERMFPRSEFQVMIADNWAPIKDKIYWNLLTKPVRIVLCGATEFNVNIDYLNLARKTKGSIHLLGSDLYNLSDLKEGDILTIGKNSFVVKNGMFAETGYDIKDK